MKVRKEEGKNKKAKETTKCCKCYTFNDFLRWIGSRSSVEMTDQDIIRCKLAGSLKSYSISVSKEVVENTLDFLRRKRENQLKMVREIKQVQFSGSEKLNESAKND